MCGNFENDDPLNDQLFEQLLATAQQLEIAPEHSLSKATTNL